MSLSFRIIPTRLGHVGIVAGERGLRRVYLPESSVRRQRAAIAREFPDAGEDRRLLPKLADEVKRYFAGEAVTFSPALDVGAASPFTRAVWKACRKVGYGRTVSYGQLARRVRRPGAARAVGAAMGRNPWPIVVPCHRVLRGDGSLGGYSGTGGVEFKRGLLEMEAAERV